MKQLKLTFLIAFFGAIFNVQSTFAAVEPTNSVGNYAPTGVPKLKGLTPEMQKAETEKFLQLTPAKFKAMTGKRLGFFGTLKLKIAQKFLKRQQSRGRSDIPQVLYVFGAIFGLAWLFMGIMDNWSGDDWWINLILTLLFWLPGLIHALIKMSKYY